LIALPGHDGTNVVLLNRSIEKGRDAGASQMLAVPGPSVIVPVLMLDLFIIGYWISAIALARGVERSYPETE